MNEQKSNYYTQQIIKVFLSQKMVTTMQLAEVVGLSEKTVRTKLENINDLLVENSLGEICKKPRVGVWLNANDEQKHKLLNLVQNKTSIESMQNSQMRFVSALRLILKINDNTSMTTQQLASNLYLSVPTVSKIIKQCKDWLALFNIELNIVRNKGFELHYTEVSYRLAIKHFIMKFNADESIENAILEFVPGIDLTMIKKKIIETENEWSFEFVDESYQEILIYTALAVNRNIQRVAKQITISNEEKQMLMKYNEYAFAESIYKKIAPLYHLDIIKEEVAFLSIQILCSKLIETNFAQDSGELLRRYDEKLRDFVAKIINVVSNVLNTDLTQDKTLFHGLLIHIRPTIFRLRYERGHSNSMVDFIKSEYKQTFRVSWIISVLFEEYYDLKVTGDELSYIALYIQSALERNENPLNVILVTQQGMGLNQMLISKVKQSCIGIHEIRTVSLHDFKIHDYSEVNVILTTGELEEKDPRIITVESFMTDSDIQKLNHKLRKLIHMTYPTETHFDSICHTFFEPDLIYTHIKIKEKRKLLEYLCNQLVKKGYVTKKYFKSVMDRESATSTSIGNNVAIPHGDQNEINEARVVIAILDEPIEWDGNDKVDVVFLLVVKMTSDYEIKKTQLFYKQYVKLVDSDERVNMLRNFASSIDLYKYLVK